MASISEKDAVSGIRSTAMRHEPVSDHESAGGTAPVPVPCAKTTSAPNGGLTAWLQVAGSFFIWFNTWGFVNAFGVYQTYYGLDLLSSSSPSDLSWIGSLQVFLLMAGGLFSGPIYDLGHARPLLLCGAFLIVFGQMMLSLCTEYWQVILAQGLTQGLGFGMLFTTTIAVVSTWFTSHMALAQGVAAAGSGLGGVLYPIVFYRLQPRVGFGWASRVIGFISLATLAFSVVIMRPFTLPKGRRRFFDPTALSNLPFASALLASFLTFAGLYVPTFYIILFAIREQYTTARLGFYLLPILNAGSTFGRIIMNYVAGKTGLLNTVIPCVLATALLTFCLIVVKSEAGMIVIVIFFGFFSGSVAALFPTFVVSLIPDRTKIGTWLGMGLASAGVGLLVGNPISGAILHSSGFTYEWVFSGLCLSMGAVTLLGIKVGTGGLSSLSQIFVRARSSTRRNA